MVCDLVACFKSILADHYNHMNEACVWLIITCTDVCVETTEKMAENGRGLVIHSRLVVFSPIQSNPRQAALVTVTSSCCHFAWLQEIPMSLSLRSTIGVVGAIVLQLAIVHGTSHVRAASKNSQVEVGALA